MICIEKGLSFGHTGKDAWVLANRALRPLLTPRRSVASSFSHGSDGLPSCSPRSTADRQGLLARRAWLGKVEDRSLLAQAGEAVGALGIGAWVLLAPGRDCAACLGDSLRPAPPAGVETDKGIPKDLTGKQCWGKVGRREVQEWSCCFL